MRLLIDTSAYSTFNRGDSRLKQWFAAEHELYIATIVIGELRAGFAGGNRLEQNEQLLQKFMDYPNVTIVTLTDKTTNCFAKIYNQLKTAGTPINIDDVWIAALAIEADIPLLTTDSDFKRVSGLQIIELD